MLSNDTHTQSTNNKSSDYGIFYKFINFLKLVYDMVDQTFRLIPMTLIKSNLEFIKQFTSHVTKFDVDQFLNKINDIVKIPNKNKFESELDQLINETELYLNKLIKK